MSLISITFPYDRATLVDTAIANGSIYKSRGWLYAKEAWVHGGTLHFIGLLSDGGVHSRYDQLAHLMKTSADHCCKKLRVHILLDGRDVEEGTSIQFVEQLEKDLEALRKWGCDARIASGGGRMFVTMDRYNVFLLLILYFNLSNQRHFSLCLFVSLSLSLSRSLLFQYRSQLSNGCKAGPPYSHFSLHFSHETRGNQ